MKQVNAALIVAMCVVVALTIAPLVLASDAIADPLVTNSGLIFTVTQDPGTSNTAPVVILVTLENRTNADIALRYDRYSNSRSFMGLFRFDVRDSKGATVPATAYEKTILAPEPPIGLGRSRSWGTFAIPHGEQRSVKIDLYRFADISVPGSYTVRVTLVPLSTPTVAIGATSNSHTFQVNDVNYPNLADLPPNR